MKRKTSEKVYNHIRACYFMNIFIFIIVYKFYHLESSVVSKRLLLAKNRMHEHIFVFVWPKKQKTKSQIYRQKNKMKSTNFFPHILCLDFNISNMIHIDFLYRRIYLQINIFDRSNFLKPNYQFFETNISIFFGTLSILIYINKL